METLQLPKGSLSNSETLRKAPVVSLIVPFEPKMTDHQSLQTYLAQCLVRAHELLKTKCSNSTCKILFHKLKNLVAGLDFHTHKKSIAIMVSRAAQKILYLDISVEERILIGDAFFVRELLETKGRHIEYLVLRLNARDFQIYVVKSNTIRKIVADAPHSAYAYVNDISEKIGNFTDTSSRREILMDKFIHHIDNSLGIIVNAYRLPVVVIGPERMVGHFASLTKYQRFIFQYIHYNTSRLSDNELLFQLTTSLKDSEALVNFNLFSQLDEAKDKQLVAAGIEEVTESALARRGRILVIEKEFGKKGNSVETKDQVSIPFAQSLSREREQIDNVIEAVLANGGQVEIVDNNALTKYKHIALIKYY